MKANTVVVISGRVCAPTVEYPEPSVLHEKQMAKFLSSCVPQLCWKLDRDIWAKVEAKEATTSWGREQSAIAICEAICDNGIGKCMKEQESQIKALKEQLQAAAESLRLHKELVEAVEAFLKREVKDGEMDTGAIILSDILTKIKSNN